MSRKLLAAAVLVAVALFSACTKNDTPGLAPDFKLEDLDGKSLSLAGLKGKPVLIDFWATWCPPCRDAIPGIQKLHANYAGKGLVVLGISMDQGEWDTVRDFVREYGMTYSVLKGTDEVMADYQVRSIPMVVLVSRDGRIVKRYLGFGGDDEIEKDIRAVLQ